MQWHVYETQSICLNIKVYSYKKSLKKKHLEWFTNDLEIKMKDGEWKQMWIESQDFLFLCWKKKKKL